MGGISADGSRAVEKPENVLASLESSQELAKDFIFGEVMRQPENVKPLLEKKSAEITYRKAAGHQGRLRTAWHPSGYFIGG